MAHETFYETRARKGRKILTILRDFTAAPLQDLVCLDVGCSSGGIALALAPYFRVVWGTDVDETAVRKAAQLEAPGNLEFFLSSGYDIPLPANSTDIAICAQVYEHVTNPYLLAREIWRVLRPGGICFFSGPNRLAIMEEHYWLPFLSWMPRRMADRYMRLFQRGDQYDAYPRFYWEIRNIWKDFIIHDYTHLMIHDPLRFAVDDKISPNRSKVLRLIPLTLLKFIEPFYPNYNWVLVKPAK